MDKSAFRQRRSSSLRYGTDFASGQEVPSASSTSSVLMNEFHQLIKDRMPSESGDYPPQLDFSEEEHAAVLEKDLAFDAPWKRIQQNTFTRWVNEHLKSASMTVTDLEVDLCDGLRLIALVEVLSRRKLPRHTKRPTFRSQKLENVSVALQFLEGEEGIKLVSIDSTDIVDGRVKLILGLIWALILHYSISSATWGDEKDNLKDVTPKQRLLTWFSNKLPSSLAVKNFTTDWNSGRVCGALDDAVAPGLCPDWVNWDPKDALRNATEAMSLAEQWLGVPQLIRPEDMVNPDIDEQSMMTYLAQFPIAKLKPGAPIRPSSVLLQEGARKVPSPGIDVRKVICGGRGLQKTGVRVGDDVVVRVLTEGVGGALLSVEVIGPDGRHMEVDIQKIDAAVYKCHYSPRTVGPHRISISYGGQAVPRSPFDIVVGPFMSSEVRVFGPGLSSGAVGFASRFNIDMNGENGTLGFVIEGPSQVQIQCKDDGDGLVDVNYWPSQAGEYAVHVMCNQEDLPLSPFMADIVDLPGGVDPGKVAVQVVESNRTVPDQPVEIVTDCRSAGTGPLCVSVYDSDYCALPIQQREISSGVCGFSFVPKIDSTHTVQVDFAGVAVRGSPFKVVVQEPVSADFQKVTCAGKEPTTPDFDRIRVVRMDSKVALNSMSEFMIDARGVKELELENFSVVITSPTGIRSDAFLSQKQTGLYTVVYSVFEEGTHNICICYEGTPINGSPFSVLAIRAGSPPIKSSGSQLVETSHYSETCGDGTVVSRRETRVSQVVSSSHSSTVFTDVIKNGYGDVQDCPSAVPAATATDVSKVVATGTGLEKAYHGKPNTFTVKADAAGYNVLLVGIYGKILHAHEIQVKHMGQANYQVAYVLKEPGEYLLTIKYGSENIPGSPFVVTCV